MGRVRCGQVTSQSSKKEIKKIEARKGEDTYNFLFSLQKKGETMQVGEDFIEDLKKMDPAALSALLLKKQSCVTFLGKTGSCKRVPRT